MISEISKIFEGLALPLQKIYGRIAYGPADHILTTMIVELCNLKIFSIIE